MANSVLQAKEVSSLSEDPRWQLVERIVASQAFAKSDRLCNFLSYTCELALTGRKSEINELNIGVRLFGRPDFDPSIDGIVRSHASRMRNRLEQFYEEEGAEEPIRLTIPKGSYVPVFEDRTVVPKFELREAVMEPEEPAITTSAGSAKDSSHSRAAIWILSAALLLSFVTIAWLLMELHQKTANVVSPAEKHPLWARLFGDGRHATVVCSDTSVAVLQDLTEKQVTMSDYVNGSYRTDAPVAAGVTPQVLHDLASRRYTAIADVGTLLRFYKLPGVADRIQFRYARDLSPDIIKDGTAVLIGSVYSDPWVQPFESHMNFVFRDDPGRRVSSIINQSPQPGELPQYDYSRSDASQKVYGVVALLPNLRRSGNVLILEGTSMAGTEAAADFVFDDALLLPFLSRIAEKNGAVPYFEVLLQSTSINGSASQLQILGYRVYPSAGIEKPNHVKS